jgi:hypothetical protein
MLFNGLLVAGFFILSLALRSFSSPFLYRLGNLCILATSYLTGYFLFGHYLGGVGCVAIWILFPWIDILGRIRHLEMPSSRTVTAQAPPTESRFPALEEITAEIIEEGFEQIEDAGWEYEQQEQFVRVFAHKTEPVRATITLVENNEICFFYITLCTRGQGERMWFTWNYPFSVTLQCPTHWTIQRIRNADSFISMMETHRALLKRHNVQDAHPASFDAQIVTTQLEEELRAQVAHNERCGLLLRNESGLVRYSWKGCCFLWFQFLKEMLRVF